MNERPKTTIPVAEAELQFCASLLREPDRVWRDAPGIVPEMFAEERCKRIVRLAIRRRDGGRGGTVEPSEFLAEEFTIGDWFEIARDTNAEVRFAYAYASEVRERHGRRMLSNLLRTAVEQVEQGKDAEVILGTLAGGAKDVQELAADGLRTVQLADIAKGLLDRIEARGRGDGQSGIPFPLAGLQEKLKGAAPGRVYVVGGRPNAGKSTVLAYLAARMPPATGKRTLYMSIEMSAEEVADRITGSLAGHPTNDMTGKGMTNKQIGDLARALKEFPRHLDFLAPRGRYTLDEIVAKIYAMGDSLGCVVIDYLHPQIRVPGAYDVRTRFQEITGKLKAVALDVQIPLFLGAQLRRSAEAAEPKLSDLKESGTIEEDADVVILLQADRDDGSMTFHIAKNRHGPVGKVEANADFAAGVFSHDEFEADEFQDM